MNVTLITLFPEIRSLLEYGVIGRALTRKILNLQTLNPREFTKNVHNTVDDKPYGGGPGMVMKYEPLRDAITTAKTTHTKGAPVIYLSPQGTPLTQNLVKELSANDDLILLAGRYEGIDQRIIDNHVDMEVSIGDYVVSGGELPAIVLLDAVTRMIPGVLDGPLSNQQDSFSRPYFDHPHYTRPEKIDNYSVPPVLLSGNHQAINEWRLKQALTNTWQTRQDLLKRRTLTQSEQEMLDEIEQQLTSKPDD